MKRRGFLQALLAAPAIPAVAALPALPAPMGAFATKHEWRLDKSGNEALDAQWEAWREQQVMQFKAVDWLQGVMGRAQGGMK